VKSQEEINEIRQAFASWLVMDNNQRRDHNLPTTKKAFAELYDTNDRQLRRWTKEDESFADLVEKKRESLAARSTNRFAPEELIKKEAESGDPDAMWEVFETTLLNGLSKGDHQFANIFARTMGKPYIEAMERQFQSDWRDLSMEEMWEELEPFLSDMQMATALRKRGWTVTRAEGGGEETADADE